MAASSSTITQGMIDSLVRTRPWVLFMGVLVMIGCGFLVLGAIAMMALGGFAGLENNSFGALGGAIAVVYLLMALLYFFPGLYLLRYGGAIGEMRVRASTVAIENALRQQLSFWRFVGILAAIIVGLYAVVLLAGVVIGIMGTSMSP